MIKYVRLTILVSLQSVSRGGLQDLKISNEDVLLWWLLQFWDNVCDGCGLRPMGDSRDVSIGLKPVQQTANCGFVFSSTERMFEVVCLLY